MRICVRIALTGLAARLRIARPSSSLWVGIGSGDHGGLSAGSEASGVGSIRRLSISTPDAPSMVAWWYLLSIAHDPSSRPSMT